MFKNKPFGVLILCFVYTFFNFYILGKYVLNYGFAYLLHWTLILAILNIIGGVGLFFMKNWARYLIIFTAVIIIAKNLLASFQGGLVYIEYKGESLPEEWWFSLAVKVVSTVLVAGVIFYLIRPTIRDKFIPSNP